jgi:hypothetical protein
VIAAEVVWVAFVTVALLAMTWIYGKQSGYREGWDAARDIWRADAQHWYEEAVGWREIMLAKTRAAPPAPPGAAR